MLNNRLVLCDFLLHQLNPKSRRRCVFAQNSLRISSVSVVLTNSRSTERSMRDINRVCVMVERSLDLMIPIFENALSAEAEVTGIEANPTNTLERHLYTLSRPDVCRCFSSTGKDVFACRMPSSVTYSSNSVFSSAGGTSNCVASLLNASSDGFSLRKIFPQVRMISVASWLKRRSISGNG